MKSITPKTAYRGDKYPSAQQAGVTRRGLLQVVLTGAAGAGAAAVGMGVLIEDAEARRGRLRGRVARPRYRAYIDLTPDHRFKGSKSAIASLVVISRDRDLAKFYNNKNEKKRAQKVVRRVLRGFTGADVKKPKRWYAMQRAVSNALVANYQKRTGRRARYTYVQLTKRTATS